MKKYFLIFYLIFHNSFVFFAQVDTFSFRDYDSERFESLIPSDEELKPLAAKIKALKKTTEKTYFNDYQTYVNSVFLDTLVTEGLAFLARNPSFESFSRKFPMAKIQQGVAFHTTGELQEIQGKKSISVRTFAYKNPDAYESINWDISVENNIFDTKILKTKNLYILKKKNEINKIATLQVYFFEKAFKKYVLPAAYAVHIDYVNILLQETVSLNLQPIDFTYQKTEKYAHELPYRAKLFTALNKIFDDFYKTDTATKVATSLTSPSDSVFPLPSDSYDPCYMPTDTFKLYEEFPNCYSLCKTFRREGVLERIKQNPQVVALIHRSIEETIDSYLPSTILEFFAVEYSSKQKLLILKRLHRIWASCGNDDAPRWHNLEIMKLAAQTQNDSVFVRALLENLINPIYNTKINPTSRTQLLTQVEKAGIDLKHVYFSFILRPFGRFWSHNVQMQDVINYKRLNQLENEIRKAIKDNNLDHQNRYSFWGFYYVLYRWKISGERDVSRKKQLLAHLNHVKNTLPKYMAEKIIFNIL